MNRYRKKVIWFVLISMLISACGQAVAAAPPLYPSSCPPNNNPYLDPINQNLINIYEAGAGFVNEAVTYTGFRQQAFNELVNHLYYSSDSVDIPVEGKTIRITITYISPELIHIIIVNHYKGKTEFSGRLYEQVQSQIAGILENNEHIFFMTITASLYGYDTTNNTPIFINFPLDQLGLTNTNDITVTPERDDHNLENPIVLSNNPEYGFFFYPMAIIQNGSCLMDWK